MTTIPPVWEVLVVDDDQAIGRTLSAILGKAGYRVGWARSGKEALELMEKASPERPFAASLLDLRLPDQSGLELLRAFKKGSPDVEVIMMTGFADLETAIEALNAGAFAYVRKPYSVDELKAALARAVDRWRLVRQNRELLAELREANAGLERKVQERTAELQSANLKLAHSVERLREFVSVATHELKTPVTVLSACAQLASIRIETLDRATLKSHMDRLIEGSHRLGRLVDSLLDLARMEDRRVAVRFERFKLADLARFIVDGLAATELGRAMRFEVAVAEDAAEVVLDKDRVDQILTNLLGNAVKYAPPGGLIRVEACRKGSSIEVSVADSGPGIPEEERAAIFDAFYRLKRSAKDRPGAGLGLTITKAIVDGLGGEIRVEDAVPHGSRFCFVLPEGSLPGS